MQILVAIGGAGPMSSSPLVGQWRRPMDHPAETEAPIDAVITWVNGASASHLRARRRYMAQAANQLRSAIFLGSFCRSEGNCPAYRIWRVFDAFIRLQVLRSRGDALRWLTRIFYLEMGVNVFYFCD